MVLITNKSLSYVLDHLSTNQYYYETRITRVSFEDAIDMLKSRSGSAEIFYDASDYNRFIAYLRDTGLTFVNSYSKEIGGQATIVCDIVDGRATVVMVDPRTLLNA